MSRKTVITICLVAVSFVPSACAITCNEYIAQGRALLFNGKLAGIRQAYQKFDEGLTSCPTNRELKFFHAVAGTAMLLVKDDGGSADSVFELARKFGIYVWGDYWAAYFDDDPCDVSFGIVLNGHDAYQIPSTAPTIDEIRNIIDDPMIPRIDVFIADLNSISDPNSFAIYLHPSEARIFFDPNVPALQADLEVDYGEVLILKGLLMALKGQLEAQGAYDLYVDEEYKLAEKVYGGSFSMNDFLTQHPDFLNVLPNDNYPGIDGAALLDQARQDWIDAIDYYFEAFNYIASENVPPGTDPQENEFLYIDPNYTYVLDEVIKDRLTTLRASLVNETPATYPYETTKTYDVYNAGIEAIGELVLVWDLTGTAGDGLSMSFTGSGVEPSNWEVDDFGIDSGNDFWVDLENYDSGWRSAYLDATLAADGNSFTVGTFSYMNADWDWVTLNGLSGGINNTNTVVANIDLNPIFGTSAPVNPRDLLPEFDEWNGPQPDTMGHGLGDDGTLGGIFPDMNQYDWQLFFELQPGGLVTITSAPGPITVNGVLGDWTPSQLVLDDICGDVDVDEEPSGITGVDIDRLYMAYNSTYLFGAITFCDDINSSNEYWYSLELSYSPYEPEALGAIALDIIVDDGVASGELWYMDLSSGYPEWHHLSDFTAATGPSAVEFRVPRANIPGGLPGRFITLESEGWDPVSYEWFDEWNGTHLKIAGLGTTQLGTITGTVNVTNFPDYNDAPIFVQAYTDPWDPEESLVAGTMIEAPGTYTLNGIGVGWQGYVRAFTPLFGFTIFDPDPETKAVEASVAVGSATRTGVNLALRQPTLLGLGIPAAGAIDPNYEQDWYAFNAVQNRTYWLDLTRVSSTRASMTLYKRDGASDIEELDYWETQHIEWTCPPSAGGRYYVKVSNDPDYQPGTGTYQIRVIVKPDDSPPDFNYDAKTDILWKRASTGSNYATLMNGLTRGSFGYLGGNGDGLSVIGGEGDFNGDGKTDILWKRALTGSNYATLMNGLTRGAYGYLGGNGDGLIIIGVGDFNGDGKTDILWKRALTGSNYATLMNGLTKGPFGYLGGNGDGLIIIGVGDFNGDGKTDILWKRALTGSNYVTLMNGLTRGPFIYLGGNGDGLIIVGVGDFNGDGKTDILWKRALTGSNYATLMNGSTKGPYGYLAGNGDGLSIIGVGDFNGDGKTDILWKRALTGSNYATLMNGLTRGAYGYLGGNGDGLSIIGVGDFNGDGKTDILWKRASSTRSNYATLMNGLTKGAYGYLAGNADGLTITVPQLLHGGLWVK